MKLYKEFPNTDHNAFHDVIVEVLSVLRHKHKIEEITFDMCSHTYDNILPRDMKFTAEQWGISDTEFRDNAYTFLKEYYETHKR